ncbi:hypothetical protein BDZ91DRAFT_732863, partial [Kalaharituber pfeilii]
MASVLGVGSEGLLFFCLFPVGFDFGAGAVSAGVGGVGVGVGVGGSAVGVVVATAVAGVPIGGELAIFFASFWSSRLLISYGVFS